ncbi:MAG: hypothetical protein ACI3VR_07275 [Intestinibacter sp.]|uniref:hypothetical protein n=1 Tax=Intestinibacter sp. TaxID=1965304 RepID=UPI003F177CEA
MKCTPAILNMLATMFPDMKIIDFVNLVGNRGNLDNFILYEDIEFESYLEELDRDYRNDNIPYMSII